MAGFHSFSMRGSAGAAPSLHTESALWMKNGPRPSSGRAFLAPPPVSSRHAALVRDDQLGLPAFAARDVGFELIGEVMHVDHRRLDAGRRQPVEHVIEQRPARERHQRLRHAQGQRPHALALAGGQHHRRPRLSRARLSHAGGPF